MPPREAPFALFARRVTTQQLSVRWPSSNSNQQDPPQGSNLVVMEHNVNYLQGSVGLGTMGLVVTRGRAFKDTFA